MVKWVHYTPIIIRTTLIWYGNISPLINVRLLRVSRKFSSSKPAEEIRSITAPNWWSGRRQTAHGSSAYRFTQTFCWPTPRYQVNRGMKDWMIRFDSTFYFCTKVTIPGGSRVKDRGLSKRCVPSWSRMVKRCISSRCLHSSVDALLLISNRIIQKIRVWIRRSRPHTSPRC